jgi:hypothetical protein
MVDRQYRIDAGQGGKILLAGQANGSLMDVVCLDVTSGDARTLLSANLSGLPRAERPGLWSHLSPDAAWTSAYSFDPAGYRYLLTRCDRTRQVSIEAWPPGASKGGEDPAAQGDDFSPDSAWYLQVLPGGDNPSQILMYDLSTLDRQSLQVLAGSPVIQCIRRRSRRDICGEAR